MKNAFEPFRLFLTKNSDRAVYRFYPDRLNNSADLFRKKFPNIQPYYAVKANNHPKIISQLSSLGFSFDCASLKELKMWGVTKAERLCFSSLRRQSSVPPMFCSHRRKATQTLGLPPLTSSPHSPITSSTYTPLTPLALFGKFMGGYPPPIFANPFKMASHLRYANKHGINLMTADCVEELEKISQYHPNAEVLLRIAVDDSKSICKFNKKFGLVPSYDNLEKIFSNKYSKGIKKVGVSFHVGSGCLSADSYTDAILKSRYVFDFAKKYGLNFNILDIGGGFIQKEPILTEVSDAVQSSLQKYFGSESSHFKIIAEPGRFMVANVADLYVKVIGKKAESQGIKYYINSSVYGAFNCKVFDYATFQFDIYRKKSIHAEGMPETLCIKKDSQGIWRDTGFSTTPVMGKNSTVFGATCDSLDVILENVSIPELEIGDYLCFRDMGAYTYSASSEFNGIRHPLVYYRDAFTWCPQIMSP